MVKKIVSRLIISAGAFLIGAQLFHLATVQAEDAKPIPPLTEMCLGLNYHRVRQPNLWNKTIPFVTQNKALQTYSVYSDDFADQLDQMLAAGVHFATPDELILFNQTGDYPDKCVWISFDDVDKSVYDNAFPILAERAIPFTLFVISGHVGETNFNNLIMATWDDLRVMRDSGLATFGSHTHDMHYLEDDKAAFLTPSRYQDFVNDLKQGRQTLEQELEIPIDSIAYPFGETNEIVTTLVRDLGFKKAYILSPNPLLATTDAHYQNRYLLSQYTFEQVIVPWLTN